MDRGGKPRRLSVRGVRSVVWIDWAKHKRPKIVGSAGGPKSAVRCSKIWPSPFRAQWRDCAIRIWVICNADWLYRIAIQY